jgi:endonuclease/exonuclease/phosphatase family metal-dependent hydrolase
MLFHFHAAWSVNGEQYGNAILSRYPIELMNKDALPKLWNKKFLEPRGAILVSIDYQGTKVNVINTHLSLWPTERLLQIKTLLGGGWLQHLDCLGPIILCGDLNMTPDSPVYKEICKRLKDSQLMLAGHKPLETWFAGYPFRRIDHIFVSPEFTVNSIQVAHTALDKLASDHLPIIVQMSLV